MQRMAGLQRRGQLNDPNLPCSGESLLPTTEHADFDADPVERARQLVIAKTSNDPADWPNGRDGAVPRETPVKYYPGMGHAPIIPRV